MHALLLTDVRLELLRACTQLTSKVDSIPMIGATSPVYSCGSKSSYLPPPFVCRLFGDSVLDCVHNTHKLCGPAFLSSHLQKSFKAARELMHCIQRAINCYHWTVLILILALHKEQ